MPHAAAADRRARSQLGLNAFADQTHDEFKASRLGAPRKKIPKQNIAPVARHPGA